MERITRKNVSQLVLKSVPEFEPLYRDHVEYHEEVIDYVLFGGPLLKFTLMNYDLSMQGQKQGQEAKDVLGRLLDFIENCLTLGDAEVIELIKDGYLETLDQQDPRYTSLKSLMGPNTRKALVEVERYFSSSGVSDEELGESTS